MEKSKKKELKISEDYLSEIIDYIGRSLVGKILKRHEIFGGNTSVIKSDTKELIYEELRHMKDILIAHDKGLQVSQFKFTNKGEGS